MSTHIHLDDRANSPAHVAGYSRLVLLAVLAAIIGVLAGVVAYLLVGLIGLISNLVFFQRVAFDIPALENHTLGPLVIVVPAIGGLLIGLMAKYGTDKIRGHGIPEAMEAVLVKRSRIAPKVALWKPLSAAVAIGTGGPFGAEGPIIQTGGAFGSLIGQVIHVTAAERKVLLACGAAAGMAATFSTPIAAVILAIELLLFEFKARSFIPLVIASTLATAVHFQLIGRGPMFELPPLDFGVPVALPFYVLLGLLCGLFATWFTRAFYWVEDMFERLPVDHMWWPAIGGLVLGVIGFFFPRVLGVGYETISAILSNDLPLTVLLVVLVFKTLALYVTLGSGTSGGLLAPMFMVGAAFGAVFAILMNSLFPGLNLSPGAFALVGMAAIFGSAARATFAFIIFAFEITRDYNAILPLMLVAVIADLVALRLMRNSIMTEKLARRGLRIHAEYEADVLQQAAVGDVMDPNPPTIVATMPVAELASRIAAGDPLYSQRQGLPIVDDAGRLVGVITRGDILRTLDDNAAPMTVLEAGTTDLIVAYPDESVSDAVAKMLRNDVGRLPVVSRQDPGKLVGYLGRSGVMGTRRARLHEENEREQGWLQRVAR